MKFLGYLLISMIMTATSSAQDKYVTERNHMVKSQLEARDITDPATLKAMREVMRHEFVPEFLRHLAYGDGPLSIGYEQTISQPYIVAYMTQELKLEPNDRVLEIGTGSGYQAAVLAKLVDTVYTIEIVEELGLKAIETFKHLGYANIKSRIGDGYHGWPEVAPFDAIIVTAAVKEIPPALIEQLADGGRLIIPVGPKTFQRHLVLVTKKGDKIKKQKRLPVAFVPFTRH
ncbi:MAG: protein-L-isoaspartate(D-aspartate) O-methyltransferase [Winogradskyella sp.]|nr:protein-L-isoaspartate(D-aspartate) O-methyltransferase [Winogradskyella sp.]